MRRVSSDERAKATAVVEQTISENQDRINSWEDLNFSKSTPIADKILKDLEEKKFDAEQKIILPKGF